MKMKLEIVKCFETTDCLWNDNKISIIIRDGMLMVLFENLGLARNEF